MKKISFDEARKNVQAQKNNSDLENLANALEYLTVRRQEIDELEDKILKTVKDIESGKIQPVDAVRNLYQEARGRLSL